MKRGRDRGKSCSTSRPVAVAASKGTVSSGKGKSVKRTVSSRKRKAGDGKGTVSSRKGKAGEGKGTASSGKGKAGDSEGTASSGKGKAGKGKDSSGKGKAVPEWHRIRIPEIHRTRLPESRADEEQEEPRRRSWSHLNFHDAMELHLRLKNIRGRFLSALIVVDKAVNMLDELEGEFSPRNFME